MTKYSDNALAIYKRLYFDETKGETRPEEVHERVANFIGDNDNEKQDFLDLMNDKTFRPNSPCLINSGRTSDKAHDKQLAACFTIGLDDSMDSIIDMWSVCAKIYASGAGSGIPITNLREAGSPINSGGKASGSLAYMKVIDLLSDTVRSGGRTRRASNLAAFKYNHPETIQIIESKENNKSLKNFNLSMTVDNTFMDSIINNENIKFPVRSPNKNKKIGEINNIKLWNKITNTAWKCGDPGLLFIDIVNQFNPLPSYGNIDVTNPCVSGDTLLLTKDGYEEIQNLINEEIEIWNGQRWTKVIPQITGHDQEMLTIGFNNGEELTCTKYHRFKLQDGSEIKAIDLKEGMKLIKWTMPILPDPDICLDKCNDPYTQGFFCGDGFYDTYHGWYCIHLYGSKQSLIEHFDFLTKRQEDGRIHIRLPYNYHSKEFVPKNSYTLNYKLKYLAGICDSDGTITKEGNIQISSINFKYLLNLKYMLNTMGTDCKINISHTKRNKLLPDGNGGLKEYQCQTCYRLSISSSKVKKLIEQGFKTYHLNLNNVNPKLENEHYIKINYIIDNNEIHKNVYCFNDPIDGMGMFNNISTLQCGEVPLPPWSVCNLGSLNLSSFIREDQTGEFFSYDAFRMAIRTATRFLDNVIDKTSYLHPNFEKMSKLTRPTGLGMMGFADILIKLNISYGSEESIKFFRELCYFLTKEAIITSIELAKEKEPINIPNQDYKHFLDLLNYYTQHDYNGALLNDFEDYGIRNSNWTCIAPTGSISLSADCSYAWEPLMALVWEKPLTDSDQVLKIIHPEFEKDLIYYMNDNKLNLSKEKVIEDIIQHKGSIQHIDYFPQEMKNKYKVAHDIDPINKIEMQSKGQKFISMAISSTCNLPNSATVEDVDKIFRLAYQKGLKGITVFRDGCLSNQPVNFGKVKDKNKDNGYVMINKFDNPINVTSEDTLITTFTFKSDKKEIDKIVPINNKRPIIRKGETVEIPTPHGKLYVTCNFDNGKPIEIFFRVGKQGALTNVLIDALGRVCSKALQNDVPLNDIIETLMGLHGEKFWYKIDEKLESSNSAESIVDAIAQIMEYYWDKPSPVVIENCYDECPECHRKSLRHDGGCRGGYCPICGYSNCG